MHNEGVLPIVFIIVLMLFLIALAVELMKNLINRFCSYLYQRECETGQEVFSVPAIFLPSILGIVISAVCLIGTTYAWYTASFTTPVLVIQSAYFDVDVNFTPDLQPKMPAYTFALEKGEYNLELAPQGTASNGYCKIIIGEGEEAQTYHTNLLIQDGARSESYTLTIHIHDEMANVSIIPQMGVIPESPETTLLANQGVITVGTASNISEGDSDSEEPATLDSSETTEETTREDRTELEAETTTTEPEVETTTNTELEVETTTATEPKTETTTASESDTELEPEEEPTALQSNIGEEAE